MVIERHGSRILKFYVPLALYLAFLLFPFYWMVNTVFKSDKELYNLKLNPFYVHDPSIASVVQLFTETIFLRWMANTFIVAISATLISLAASLLAAYAIQRIRFVTSRLHRARHLLGISRPADHPVHPSGAYHLPDPSVGFPVGADPDVPDVSHPVLYLAPHGVLQVHPQGDGRMCL